MTLWRKPNSLIFNDGLILDFSNSGWAYLYDVLRGKNLALEIRHNTLSKIALQKNLLSTAIARERHFHSLKWFLFNGFVMWMSPEYSFALQMSCLHVQRWKVKCSHVQRCSTVDVSLLHRNNPRLQKQAFISLGILIFVMCRSGDVGMGKDISLHHFSVITFNRRESEDASAASTQHSACVKQVGTFTVRQGIEP